MEQSSWALEYKTIIGIGAGLSQLIKSGGSFITILSVIFISLGIQYLTLNIKHNTYNLVYPGNKTKCSQLLNLNFLHWQGRYKSVRGKNESREWQETE